MYVACADRLVGGLQQILGGLLLRRVLCGRRHDQRRGCQKQDPDSMSHRFSPTGIVPSGSGIELPMAGFGEPGPETICCFPGAPKVPDRPPAVKPRNKPILAADSSVIE